jgi:HlyD family secretion protein
MKKIASYTLLLLLIGCGKKMEETKPIKKEITETVFASGILEANDLYNLTAQTEGYITSISFNEGDILTKGKIVVTLENNETPVNASSASELLEIAENNTKSSAPLLKQAETNIEIAKQKMELDEVQMARYKKLWESNSIAKIEYENIELNFKNSKLNYESAKQNYNKIKNDAQQIVVSQKATKKINNIVNQKNKVIALTSGKVFKKYKQVGDYVRRGDNIALIGSADVFYAKINVDESNIARLKLGQKAIIQLNTQKQKNYNGELSKIYPQFDDNSKSYLCELKFTEPLDFKILNTPLQCNIIVGAPEMAILIPKKYLDFNNQVLIKDQKEKKKVETKIIGGEWVQVVSGLTTEDIIITEKIIVE